jgi:hypothetical protein
MRWIDERDGELTFSGVGEASWSDVNSRIFVSSVLKQAGHRTSRVSSERLCYFSDYGYVAHGVVAMTNGVQKFRDDGNYKWNGYILSSN